jgi:hypothetical protein
MPNNKNHVSLINSFLPIFVVLAQYTVGGFSLGLILLFILSVVDLIRYRVVSIHKWMVVYILVCLFLQIFLHNQSKGILTILIMFFIFLASSGSINEKALYKSYKLCGTVVMIGLMYHVVLVYFFKQTVNPITILPIGEDLAANWVRSMVRPVSFFSEPQAYASYIVPFLFLSLKFKDYYWAVVITLTVFLSKSTQGFAMVMSLWSIHFFYSKNKYLSVLIFLSFLSLYLGSQFFEYAREKMENEAVSSVRLTRGFEIFGQMTSEEKIIGVGFQNVAEYVYNIKDSFEWGVGNEGYMLGFITGFSGNMVQFGLIGAFFLLLMYYKFWKNYDFHSHALLFTIFISSFAQNLVFNTYFVYFFLLYLGINRNHCKRLLLKNASKIHFIQNKSF